VSELQLLYNLTNILSVFLIIAILVGVKQHLVILYCTSLITNDVEHIFMCLLDIPMSSFMKYLFKAFGHFSHYIYILNRNPLPNKSVAKIQTEILIKKKKNQWTLYMWIYFWTKATVVREMKRYASSMLSK